MPHLACDDNVPLPLSRQPDSEPTGRVATDWESLAEVMRAWLSLCTRPPLKRFEKHARLSPMKSPMRSVHVEHERVPAMVISQMPDSPFANTEAVTLGRQQVHGRSGELEAARVVPEETLPEPVGRFRLMPTAFATAQREFEPVEPGRQRGERAAGLDAALRHATGLLACP